MMFPFLYRKISAYNKEILIILSSLVSIGIIIAIFDSCALGVTMRYELDFLPLFVLATGILVFYLAEITRKSSRALYTIFAFFVLSTVIWGAAFNIGTGFTGPDDKLKTQNPGLYYAVAREFYPTLSLYPQKNGPVTMKIIFPSGHPVNGMGEPIVVTGQTNQGDILFVNYETDNSIVFGIDHWGSTPVYSKSTTIVPGADNNLKVNMGSLYQPLNNLDPYPPRSKECFIQLNDEVLFENNIPYYTSDPENVTIGVNNIGGTTTVHDFSGIIINPHRTEI